MYFCHRCGKDHSPTCDGYCGLQVDLRTCDKRAGHVKRGDPLHVDWDHVMGTDELIEAIRGMKEPHHD